MYFVAPSVYEEDELYEEFVCETNLVYEAVGDSLVEVEKYSRKPLKYHMLQSSKVWCQVILTVTLADEYAWFAGRGGDSSGWEWCLQI